MGNKSSRDNNDTIDWNNINTEDMSSSIAIGGASLNKDAKELVSRLDISSLRDSNLDNNNKSNDIFKKLYKNNNTKSDYSKTSPFISSEMYNYLLENSSSSNIDNGIQKGGRLETSSTDQNNSDNFESRTNKVMNNLTDSSIEINGGNGDDGDDLEEEEEEEEKKRKKEEEEEDEEKDEEENEDNSLETTDTINEAGDVNDTMADVTEEELKTAESQVDEEDGDDDNDDDNDDDDEDEDEDEDEDDSKELEDDSSDDNQMGGRIGYTSSSAHTSKSSEYDTTISIGNNKVLSESINTSDINMVSVDN